MPTTRTIITAYIANGVPIHTKKLSNMLKHQNIYFTGKVLNVKELASDNAKSFRFSKQEREQLDLEGLPIRLEHEDNLEVGSIKTSWNKNGEHWVFGSINKNNIPATFAKHALMKSGPNQTNKPYYTGLSLQHVHREYPDGTSEKKGIEVSLCTDPRRPNCNIVWTSAPQTQTNNNTYKLVTQLASSNTIDKTINMQTEQEPQTQTQETPTTTETPTAPPAGAELSEKVYDELAKLMDNEKKQQDKIKQLEEQLAQHNETLEKEKKKKQEEDAAKGRALMNTFLEHVKELVGDQDGLQQQVEPLIAANPEGMGRVMEIVSKASKKYAENNLALQQAKASLKDKELELKFQQLIQSKLGANPIAQPQEITQAASTKKRPAAQTTTVNKVAQQASATKTTSNPYAPRVHNRNNTRRRPQQRKVGGMNDNLLKAYNAAKGDGLQAMAKLHRSLAERPRYY